MDVSNVTALVAAGGAVGAGLLKTWDWLAGKGQRAANVRATEQATMQSDVTTLRDIIAEVRTSEAQKVQRIDNLERRMALLEDRERHMLTRAAVHEAWDQMAFALLAQHNPDHPPPPPLTVGNERLHPDD